jgi:type VI secretion system protein VasG
MIMDMCSDPELLPDPEGLNKALRAPLLEIFPPALLGRLVTIPYYPLSSDMIGKITVLQLNRIKKRVEAAHSVPFEYSDAVVEEIVNRCQELESGGRMIDAIVTNTMLPDISAEFLKKMMEGDTIEKVSIGVVNNEFIYNFA